MNDDDVAQWRAMMDQNREAMKDLAAAVGTFHSELLEWGFEDAEALELAAVLLTTVLQRETSG